MLAIRPGALAVVATLACGGPAAPVDQGRDLEWHLVPSPVGSLTVALVRPDAAAGAGPHPVVFALPWGAGDPNLTAGLVQSYWDEVAPARGYYVVAPAVQGSSLAEDADEVIPAIFEWMDDLLDYDPARVLLTGASNGGRGIFYAAVSQPERFAGLIGMPGRFEGPEEGAAALTGKRVWLLVGQADEGWVQASAATKALLESHGIETTLEVVPGQGHVLRLDQGTLMDWVDEALGR